MKILSGFTLEMVACAYNPNTWKAELEGICGGLIAGGQLVMPS